MDPVLDSPKRAAERRRGAPAWLWIAGGVVVLPALLPDSLSGRTGRRRIGQCLARPALDDNLVVAGSLYRFCHRGHRLGVDMRRDRGLARHKNHVATQTVVGNAGEPPARCPLVCVGAEFSLTLGTTGAERTG